MGLIEVKTYTSVAEMMAAHAATRKRLLYGQPIKRALPAQIISFSPPTPLPVPSRKDMAAHDKRIMGFVEDMLAYVSPVKFIEETAKRYKLGMRSILCEDRTYGATLVRQKIAWMVKREYPRLSYPRIGKIMHRDHTTIIHSIRKIDALIAANDPSVADLKGWLE